MFMEFRLPRVIFGDRNLTKVATMMDDAQNEQLVILSCSVEPSNSDATSIAIGCNHDDLPTPPRPTIVSQLLQQLTNTPDSGPANSTLASQTDMTDYERDRIQTDALIFVTLICIVLLMMIGGCTFYHSYYQQERRRRPVTHEQQNQQPGISLVGTPGIFIEVDMFELEAR